MNKYVRAEVYAKYDGHCAYCGRLIEYKDMQVDHFIAIKHGGTDDIANLMPACRMCNHYKRAHDLETFQQYISNIPKQLQNNYIYKIAKAYGIIVEEINPDIKFYFERR